MLPGEYLRYEFHVNLNGVQENITASDYKELIDLALFLGDFAWAKLLHAKQELKEMGI